MNVQVKHEAEHYRQHARYRIPALLIYNNKVYRVAEWSVAGLSISNFPDSVKDKTMFNAHLTFNFDSFRFSVKLDIEKLRTLPDGTAACRFNNLSTEHLSIFHQIINAFLAGEVIEVNDVLNVVSRESTINKDFSQRMEPERTFLQKCIFHFKRFLGYALFGSIIFLLSMFVLSTAYERMFVVNSLSAKVTANSTILRSPEDGFFQDAVDNPNQPVQKGDLMGIVKLVSGGASSVESPCDCIVVERFVGDGLFIGQGEPVYSVMPAGERMFVEAQIPFEDVKKVRVSHEVEVILTTGEIIQGKVERVVANTRKDASKALLYANADQQIGETATVIISLASRLGVQYLDSVAYVSISTLKGNR